MKTKAEIIEEVGSNRCCPYCDKPISFKDRLSEAISLTKKQYEEKINELEKENKEYKQLIKELGQRGHDWRATVNKLKSQRQSIIDEVEKIYLRYLKEPRQSIKADLEQLLQQLKEER